MTARTVTIAAPYGEGSCRNWFEGQTAFQAPSKIAATNSLATGDSPGRIIECGVSRSGVGFVLPKNCIGLQINSPAENTAEKQRGRPFELTRSDNPSGRLPVWVDCNETVGGILPLVRRARVSARYALLLSEFYQIDFAIDLPSHLVTTEGCNSSKYLH
jgi:hypothetical protein